MSKSFSLVIAIALIAVSFSDAFAGAAICIHKEKTAKRADTHGEYFVSFDSLRNGWAAERASREDYKAKYEGYPKCKNTGDLINGFFVIVENEKVNSSGENIRTLGFGFGSTKTAAVEDAAKHLGSINWHWKPKDGYKIIATQEF